LIPNAISDETPAEETFFAMTRAYFDGDVSTGQLLNALDLSKAENPDGKNQPYLPTMDELAQPRRHRCKVSGFETLHPRFLGGISQRLFSAIDEGRAERRDGNLDMNFLLIVNFLLQLMHIAEDGTGRTGEDMLVLLAAESGRTLSLSQTGYRGAMEGSDFPIYCKAVAQRILFFEVTRNFYRSLGITPPEVISFDIEQIITDLGAQDAEDADRRLGWPDGLGPTIAEVYPDVTTDAGAHVALFKPPHMYRLFAEFLALEAIYLTLCLQDPTRHMAGLKARYPGSVNCGLHLLTAGLSRDYHPIPDVAGDVADEAVALIEAVRMGWAERDEAGLDAAVARVEAEDENTGKLFRRELLVFLTEEEKSTIGFEVPDGVTGEQLEELIRAGINNVHGSKDD